MTTIPDEDCIINEQADRELGRLIIKYGLLSAVLLVIIPLAMVPFNVQSSPFFGDRRFIDTVSTFVVLLPFFLGTSRVFAARLRIGRELIQRKQWNQAVAALEPFAKPTQRFMDTTGEAHKLLAVAYSKLGNSELADQALQFASAYRSGIVNSVDIKNKSKRSNPIDKLFISLTKIFRKNR